MRLEPAEPSTSSTSPARPDHHGGGHHARHPATRRVAVEAQRVEVLLAHDVVHVNAGAGHDDARALAVGAGHAARPAVAVEHRDVRRGAEVPAWLPAGPNPVEHSHRPPPPRGARSGSAPGSPPRPGPRRTRECARPAQQPSPPRSHRARAGRDAGRAGRARRPAACPPPRAAGWSAPPDRGSPPAPARAAAPGRRRAPRR